MKVLIVEDQDADYQLLSRFLEIEDINTERSTNVDDAIRMLREYKPDIVLLDVQLEIKGSPDLDRRGGIKVLEIMEREGMLDKDKIPCFITSIFCSDEDKKNYTEYGVKEERIFKKPFDIEELVNKIKKG